MMSLPDSLEIALQHHRDGRLAEAETIYRRILVVEPHHARALYFLGVIAHQASRNELAADLIRKAISREPGTPDFHCGLGLALAGLGRTEEAVAAYRQALELAPRYLEAHFNLGKALEKLGRLDEAVPAYRRSTQFGAEAICGLGRALRAQGRLNEAVGTFRRALQLEPNDPAARGGLEEAIVEIQRALDREPKGAAESRRDGFLPSNAHSFSRALSPAARKMKVLYFTGTQIDLADNGGGLVCRNHLRRMAADARLEVSLCVTGAEIQEAGISEFADSIGVPFYFIPFQVNPDPAPLSWPFAWEKVVREQPQVDEAFADLLAATAPDVVAIDYLLSALYVPSLYSSPVRKVTITLNREAEFYEEKQRVHAGAPDPSVDRLAAFEQVTYRRSDAVIALAAGDLPAKVSADRAHVVPPLFDPAPDQWSYRGNGRILFVGNTLHHPNLLAVHWLATELAPVLESICPTARLQVIGVEEVPPAWRRSNVDFLGVGDRSLVEEKLVTTDLFVAPIANNFGSKIKLLDCLSRATPFVATEEAMSGLPFISDVPRIQLDQPESAAATIANLIEEKTLLTALSQSLRQQLSRSLVAQQGVWGDIFEKVCALPVIQRGALES